MVDKLKVGVVGGLGLMASPMARHWKPDGPVQVISVHDRGNPGEAREKARRQWREHGAVLTRNLNELGNGVALDGLFVCCGKNGDDLSVIRASVELLSEGQSSGAFLCHMSTVSTDFVSAAQRYCEKHGVAYVNYPLTGGAVGAEKGTLLILASGSKALFDRLEPALRCLGTSKYFGDSPTAGAEVKLIGQVMVFNGLIGICSAAALHSECFQNGKVGGDQQSDFFDFLNAGAGGTRQWDVILSFGIRQDIWTTPFSASFGAVDAIYAAQLCIEKKISHLSIRPLFEIALAFAFLIRKNQGLATHAILREMVAANSHEFDKFILENLLPNASIEETIIQVVKALPENVRECVKLGVTEKDFEHVN